MAKFYGSIGFSKAVDKGLGTYEQEEVVRQYYGDILYDRRRWSASQDSTNDELKLTNSLSILADSFALDNLGAMRWVEMGGVRWKVDTANLVYPRIELTFGGVWNG